MLEDTIREKILQRLTCVLSNIRSGLTIEACSSLPEPFFVVLDGCDDQDSVDGWIPSGVADTPTLNTTTFFKAPGAINLIKTATGTSATWEKTLVEAFDATNKVGTVTVYTTDSTKFNTNNAVTVKFGTDNANYYEFVFPRSTLQDLGWISLSVNIDSDIGVPSTVVGIPDPTQIQYLSIELQTATGIVQVAAGEFIMDFWNLFDASQWFPLGSAEAPENTFDPDPVVGLSFIGYGRRAPNADVNFGLGHTFPNPVNGTGGELETWLFINDKTVLNPSALFGSIGILIGSSLSDLFIKTLFFDDLVDRVNDLTNGWNQIKFFPETESDLILGSPDITDLNVLAVLASAVSDISVAVGELGIDFIRFTNFDGDFATDVKKVYRYKIGQSQTAGGPIITMIALDEEKEAKFYPIIHNKLTVGIDGEIVLSDEDTLDEELGKLATDVEVAVSKQQELWGIAQYVEILNWRFSVMKGTSTGILSGDIQVEYTNNQLDPRKQGL